MGELHKSWGPMGSCRTMSGAASLAIASLLLLPAHTYAAPSLHPFTSQGRSSNHRSQYFKEEGTWRISKKLRTGNWDQAHGQVRLSCPSRSSFWYLNWSQPKYEIEHSTAAQHEIPPGPVLSSAKKVYLRAFLKEVSWTHFMYKRKGANLKEIPKRNFAGGYNKFSEFHVIIFRANM